MTAHRRIHVFWLAVAGALAPLIAWAGYVSAETVTDSGQRPDVIATIMKYGPAIIQLTIIVVMVYHAWQRNILKTLFCAAAAVVTFILGW